ncbi:MAG: hypothetical protein LKJ76_01875 [Lachnospiraceae bacterium]|nr:hypothetical protein [Lachnospiraceae bacterium]
MIAVLLTILKTVGIVLLWILAVAAALLLLVLFVPVRYAAAGKETDNTPRENFDIQALKDHASGSFAFSWLLHLVRGGISWPDDPHFRVKVLFFQVFCSNGEKTGKKQPEKNRKNRRKKKKHSPAKAAEVSSSVQTRTDKKSGTAESGQAKQGKTAGKASSGTAGKDAADRKAQGGAKRKYKSGGIYDKIKKIFSNAGYYRDVMESEEFGRAFEKASRQLKRVAGMAAPKKWHLDCTAGLGDPEKTGQLLEVLAILYPFTNGRLTVDPDFQNCILRADGEAKGRITLFVLLYAFLIFKFDKDIRGVTKLLKREDS